jgi:hypothetical protein
MTAAGFFRTIDREKPTLLLDEADDIFKTGVALRSLVNDSWQHGANVKRVGPGGRIQRFNIFCPKIITMKGTSALPEATASRCIVVKMKPKLESEQVEDYVFVSNEEQERYHAHTSSSGKIRRCCVDRLRSPPRADIPPAPVL